MLTVSIKEKKMSKLAMLAKSRRENQQDSKLGEKSSVSILDKLMTRKTEQADTPVRRVKRVLKRAEAKGGSRDEAPKTVNAVDAVSKDAKQKPIFSFQTVTFEHSPFARSPVSQTSSTMVKRFKTKHSDQLKSANHLYVPFMMTNGNLVVKQKINFDKPSPDDLVKQAQTQAFDSDKKKETEVVAKVSQLKVSATPSVTKPRVELDVNSEIVKRSTKPNLSFVVIGHVDAGKSTLTGRLLLESETVSMSQYNKLKREAEKAGKSSFSLAWVMDQTPEERNRGVTIDICSSSFETAKGHFTIVDAPGHRDFVPNMITGVAQADLAVLVVDSSTNAFESGFNLDGQTKEHTILARSLGITKLLVCVNKMDQSGWDQHRFEEIKDMMDSFLEMSGWDIKSNVKYVPCSGLSGANVSKKYETPALDWYHSGPCVIEALESFEATIREFTKPFVLQINDIDTSKSEFTGRIDTGTIQVGETVVFSPSGTFGVVDSITLRDSKVNIAIAGDSITIRVKNVDLDNVRTGDVMSIVTHEIPSVTKFEARVVTFDMDRPLLVGTPFVLFRGNVQQQAKISKVLTVFDKNGEPSTKRKAKHLIAKQSAIVEIETERKLPLQLFKENKMMGRIVLRKEGRTVAAGVVEKI